MNITWNHCFYVPNTILHLQVGSCSYADDDSDDEDCVVKSWGKDKKANASDTLLLQELTGDNHSTTWTITQEEINTIVQDGNYFKLRIVFTRNGVFYDRLLSHDFVITAKEKKSTTDTGIPPLLLIFIAGISVSVALAVLGAYTYRNRFVRRAGNWKEYFDPVTGGPRHSDLTADLLLSHPESQAATFLNDHASEYFIRFADLQILELVGVGASAQVFRTIYCGEIVATKRLAVFAPSNDHSMGKLLAKEATALSKLHHPNIVQFLGLCYKDSFMYIVTEYLPCTLLSCMESAEEYAMGPVSSWYSKKMMFGKKKKNMVASPGRESSCDVEGGVPLLSLQSQEGGGGGGGHSMNYHIPHTQRVPSRDNPTPLLVCDFFRIACGIAYGLEYLHSRRMQHRDVKPSNILVGFNYDDEKKIHTKLCDFGVAKFSDTYTTAATMTSGVGTPAYMAPEVMLGESRGTQFSADTYAFGMVLWGLWACRQPFCARINPDGSVQMPTLMPLQIMHRVSMGFRPNLDELKMPDNLSALIEEMWHQDQSQRPNMTSVRTTLEQMSKRHTNNRNTVMGSSRGQKIGLGALDEQSLLDFRGPRSPQEHTHNTQMHSSGGGHQNPIQIQESKEPANLEHRPEVAAFDLNRMPSPYGKRLGNGLGTGNSPPDVVRRSSF